MGQLVVDDRPLAFGVELLPQATRQDEADTPAAPDHRGDLLVDHKRDRRASETELGGRLPVNTGGGLIAFGHPVGATGVKQILEIVRQIRGECGDYQLEKRPSVGLCANMGGDDRTTVVTVLRG